MRSCRVQSTVGFILGFRARTSCLQAQFQVLTVEGLVFSGLSTGERVGFKAGSGCGVQDCISGL